ncbi:MAG: response regulator transcription factor [Microscillaceae bacterium]|jgi:DNA-binding NarL/FixJ family response regulator|nr:response regulator transcription factor [Microscillaceae bacterium]
MIKFALVDDNLAFLAELRQELNSFNDLQLVLMATNAQDCLNGLANLSSAQLPEVILMDIEMPQTDGIEATRQIHALYPPINVVMLTTFSDDDKVVKAIQNGAKGYLLKTENAQQIHNAICEVAVGNSPLSPAIARKILDIFNQSLFPPALPPSPPIVENDYKLTTQEQKILDYVHQGLPYKRIGELLFIEESTVKKHIRNIYTKLGVHNKVQALHRLNKMT